MLFKECYKFQVLLVGIIQMLQYWRNEWILFSPDKSEKSGILLKIVWKESLVLFHVTDSTLIQLKL